MQWCNNFDGMLWKLSNLAPLKLSWLEYFNFNILKHWWAPSLGQLCSSLLSQSSDDSQVPTPRERELHPPPSVIWQNHVKQPFFRHSCLTSNVARRSSVTLSAVSIASGWNSSQANSLKMESENPIYGPFFGVMGAASAMIFSGKLLF